MSPIRVLSTLAASSLILAAASANAAGTRSGNQSLQSSPQRSTLFDSVTGQGSGKENGGGRNEEREFHNNGKGHKQHGNGNGYGHDKGRGHGHDDDDSPGC